MVHVVEGVGSVGVHEWPVGVSRLEALELRQGAKGEVRRALGCEYIRGGRRGRRARLCHCRPRNLKGDVNFCFFCRPAPMDARAGYNSIVPLRHERRRTCAVDLNLDLCSVSIVETLQRLRFTSTARAAKIVFTDFFKEANRPDSFLF